MALLKRARTHQHHPFGFPFLLRFNLFSSSSTTITTTTIQITPKILKTPKKHMAKHIIIHRSIDPRAPHDQARATSPSSGRLRRPQAGANHGPSILGRSSPERGLRLNPNQGEENPRKFSGRASKYCCCSSIDPSSRRR